MRDMATQTIPTTISPEAAALAKEYGVERELDAILDKGREMVAGLREIVVEAEPPADMGDPMIIVRAVIDPTLDDDASHQEWWSWRIDAFGVSVAERFLVTTTTQWWANGR
jgi:hypothetical protein